MNCFEGYLNGYSNSTLVIKFKKISRFKETAFWLEFGYFRNGLYLGGIFVRNEDLNSKFEL